MDATSRADEYDHPVSDLIYVVSNIPGPGSRLEDFESEFSVGCSCDQTCRDDCLCNRGTANYDDGRLVLDKESLIVECNSSCTCAETCGNRVVQLGPLSCLTISEAKCNRMGLGLYTTKSIQKGQFICEYAGEVIGIEEAKKRLQENRAAGRMNYVLVVSEHIGEKRITTCIDPAKFGNIGRYANHNCQPNSVLMPVRADIVIPRLCLFAIRDIEPMEEITFNYAGDATDSVQSLSETPCLCGSGGCLGFLPHSPL